MLSFEIKIQQPACPKLETYLVRRGIKITHLPFRLAGESDIIVFDGVALDRKQVLL